ncbi:hypothetical protein F7734_54860 [Scytonema sp. UIC 10036]|nr:hypothetical protein [Scytonema sp. UIC 10036]
MFEVLQEHSLNKRPPVSEEEKARREAEDEAFDKRCDEIFQRVRPELIQDHYNWAIMIEPNSGNYVIDPNPEVAFQKIRDKHPNARIMEMRLNKTGAVGRV